MFPFCPDYIYSILLANFPIHIKSETVFFHLLFFTVCKSCLQFKLSMQLKLSTKGKTQA